MDDLSENSSTGLDLGLYGQAFLNELNRAV